MLPILYTPINCLEILQTRFLTVSFQLTQSTYLPADNFAFAVFDMKDFLPFPNSEYQQELKA